MTKAIVDLFEIIEVDINQVKSNMLTFRLCNELSKTIV